MFNLTFNAKVEDVQQNKIAIADIQMHSGCIVFLYPL